MNRETMTTWQAFDGRKAISRPGTAAQARLAIQSRRLSNWMMGHQPNTEELYIQSSEGEKRPVAWAPETDPGPAWAQGTGPGPPGK